MSISLRIRRASRGIGKRRHNHRVGLDDPDRAAKKARQVSFDLPCQIGAGSIGLSQGAIETKPAMPWEIRDVAVSRFSATPAWAPLPMAISAARPPICIITKASSSLRSGADGWSRMRVTPPIGPAAMIETDVA